MAPAFTPRDPGGFLVADASGGKSIGCISAVSYAGRFGFIGLYIVAPGWRGKGLGLQALAGRDGAAGRPGGGTGWCAGAAGQLSPQRFCAGLEQRPFCRRGPRRRQCPPPEIVPLATVDARLLAADDRRVFPAPRDAFLRAWVGMPDATGLAWLEDGRLVGWGLVRRCREGHKIAPLVADDRQVARALLAALCAAVPAGDGVYLDVPLPNAEAVAMAQAEGMRSVFETARMYAGAAPPCELQRVYGLTSFELG